MRYKIFKHPFKHRLKWPLINSNSLSVKNVIIIQGKGNKSHSEENDGDTHVGIIYPE